MIIDGVSATYTPEHATILERAVASFVRFIERRLNVSVVRNGRMLPSDPALLAPLKLGAVLKERGVLTEFGKAFSSLPDEPRMYAWYAICNNSTAHRTGGATWESEPDALYAALAEGLERYLWYTQTDYFLRPTAATTSDIARKGKRIAPEAFAGYDAEVRRSDPKKELRDDASYLWIQGTSLVRGDMVYVPAQVVSGVRNISTWPKEKEPAIRTPTTNGLATSPTLAGARLGGVLELIEREAYMMLWFNQLTPPRLSLEELCAGNARLARGIAACERYRLKPHVLSLPTDAPTHAVAVVLEDLSDVAPRFTLGLRAHRSLPHAIEKAATEALRARRAHRTWASDHSWNMEKPVGEIGHRERVYYWGVPEHAKQLEFLIEGAVQRPAARVWDNDSETAHLERIIRWCAEKEMECISFSLGRSKKNPTPWHIEMVVMPDLQPTYLTESTRAFGGTRWRDIPRSLGYPVREEPFADAPHPFS